MDGLAIIIGIALLFLLAIAVIGLVLRRRGAAHPDTRQQPPKSPRGRTGV